MTIRIDWTHIDPVILSMHSEGRTPYAISKTVGISRETVVSRMECALGISIARRGPRPVVDWVSDSEIRCNVCSKIKSTSQYYSKIVPTVRRGVQYWSRCKDCVQQSRAENYKDKPMSWRKKIKDIETSANRRNLKFNLTEMYLLFIYSNQNQKCVYTDSLLPFTTGTQSKSGPRRDSLSIDRFDQTKGYIIGNVLICSSRANSIKFDMNLEEFKVWMPSWYERGVNTLTRLDIEWTSVVASTHDPLRADS